MKQLDTKVMNPRNKPGAEKGTELQRDLMVTKEEKDKYVDNQNVIDCNKRKRFGDEPKFTK